MGTDLTSTNVNGGYTTCRKPNVNSTIQDADVNNILPPQGTTNTDKEEALAGAATTLSLHSPPTDNLNSQNLNQSHMKCYYNHSHCCILDYFNEPIPDDAVMYTGYIPFQYDKIEGRYTEFMGNLIGRAFIANK